MWAVDGGRLLTTDYCALIGTEAVRPCGFHRSLREIGYFIVSLRYSFLFRPALLM